MPSACTGSVPGTPSGQTLQGWDVLCCKEGGSGCWETGPLPSRKCFPFVLMCPSQTLQSSLLRRGEGLGFWCPWGGIFSGRWQNTLNKGGQKQGPALSPELASAGKGMCWAHRAVCLARCRHGTPCIWARGVGTGAVPSEIDWLSELPSGTQNWANPEPPAQLRARCYSIDSSGSGLPPPTPV